MRALAKIVMQGPTQAALVMAVCTFFPFLSWVAAAASSLVLLRFGVKESVKALILSFPIAVFWYISGEPRILVTLLGTQIMAILLRSNFSWNTILLVSALLGVGYSVPLSLNTGFQEILDIFSSSINLIPRNNIEHLFSNSQYSSIHAEELLFLKNIIPSIVTSITITSAQITSILSLMIARYWQAALFNTGGFSAEFTKIRIPLTTALLLPLFLLIGFISPSLMIIVLPCYSVVFFFSGISLVHRASLYKKNSNFWLTGFYINLVLFIPIVYPLIVIIGFTNSLLHFATSRSEKQES